MHRRTEFPHRGSVAASIVSPALLHDPASPPQVHMATTGVDFYLRKYVVKDKLALVQLWDIAGQDRFGSIYRVFYQHALGAVVVFDVTDQDTMLNALKWKRQVDAKCSLPNGEPLPVWLCANKCDLPHEVNLAGMDDFCKDNGFQGWSATSAKTGKNVDSSLKSLVENILSHGDIFEVKAAADAEVAAETVSIEGTAGGAGGEDGAPGDGKCC